MKLLLVNALLAFIWAAITGAVTLGNLLIGFLLGYIVLLVASPAIDDSGYTKRLWYGISFIFYFIKELFISSIRVAIDVMKPSFKMQSGIIGIPLDANTDLEKTLLANSISLTPGTLSLDYSKDGKTLYIHAMYVDNGDIEAVRTSIKEGMEKRILQITRTGAP
ncbi:MAG: Na+/H+ antiporter subunit E [Balneolales bacterium]|nr:Na+/H+ antiporter subunit E [Balneolales bacterium]